MNKVVIIGGGWAGCSAAVTAVKQGCSVTVIEKTDLLLGAGNAGGIMRNNGRFTAAEENIAMGAGELFEITDRLSTHKNVHFPGHAHASFYDVTLTEPAVGKLLKSMGVEIRLMTRAVDVTMENREIGENTTLGRIKGITLIEAEGRQRYTIEADAFVEATGSSGPMGNCMRYGKGCAMCIQRCPSFGGRVSITGRAGMSDMMGQRNNGVFGAFSGSCKVDKRSLSEKLQEELAQEGFAVVPLPQHMINKKKLSEKVCSQYALQEFAENLVIIDTGYAKIMTPFFNLETLRQVEGFENVRFADPYSGGFGNSIRYMDVGERDKYLRAAQVENLFLAGEKSGFFVGHTEAITTGALAGYNAALTAQSGRVSLTAPSSQRFTCLLDLSRTLAVGELIAFTQDALLREDGLRKRFTFAGGEFFRVMKEKNLYTTDVKEIEKRVENAGLMGIYNTPQNMVE